MVANELALVGVKLEEEIMDVSSEEANFKLSIKLGKAGDNDDFNIGGRALFHHRH